MRVMVDRSVAEAFVQGGRAGFVVSDNRYTDSSSSVSIFNNGGAPVPFASRSVPVGPGSAHS